jgi:hypothetical protein
MAAAIAVLSAGCASQQANEQNARDTTVSSKVAETLLKPLPGAPYTPYGTPVKDDPAEPWSPNYGSEPRSKDVAPSRAPAWHDNSTTRVAIVDEDAVIRRAVANHEMQRQ